MYRMPTIPPPPSELMIQTEKIKRFLDELLDVSREQVTSRDMPIIQKYISQHPDGLWAWYEGENDDSFFKVHDVEFIADDGEQPDRIRIVFKRCDERTGRWDSAGEEVIPLA